MIYGTLSASYRQVKIDNIQHENAVICSKYRVKQSNLAGILKHQQLTGKLPASYRQVKLRPIWHVLHIPWSRLRIEWLNQFAIKSIF